MIRLRTDNGDVVIVDPDKDTLLTTDRVERSTRWNNYRVHETQNGHIYFYMEHITLWQGEGNTYDLMTADKMREQLSEFTYFDDDDKSDIERYFPDFFNETA